jgi:hypothetical protein
MFSICFRLPATLRKLVYVEFGMLTARQYSKDRHSKIDASKNGIRVVKIFPKLTASDN